MMKQTDTEFYFDKTQKIASISTSDWPHAITLGDVNADGKDELVLGLLDQTIEVYEWNIVYSKGT